MREAGVDFGILYDGESNAGNDVRRVGEEGLYEVLAAANVNALSSASFKSIVTTDPHSFNTIRNEYPDFGGKYEIEHYTSFVRRLFAEGRLKAAQPTFARTGGVHASGLFTPDGELVAAREDVGRHNALDKLIGWALAAERIPLSDHLLLVSGRVSYEIVQKAISASLPLIAAVGAPSSLAIELAERFHLTLVGFLRPDTMNVYANPERVIE